ncbi:MAG: hypothetical protein EHM67_12690 [Hyphomicrobiaceae bacterium]|nr:MAG: hypothetical protein EHM67_12690 [Hyphomicrobiaceae bacterium]
MSKHVNDQVEHVHLRLYNENEGYRKYFLALFREETVEGSIDTDETMAAIMLRDYASGCGVTDVAALKLADIRKATNVVMRRYRASRSQRRETI